MEAEYRLILVFYNKHMLTHYLVRLHVAVLQFNRRYQKSMMLGLIFQPADR